MTDSDQSTGKSGGKSNKGNTKVINLLPHVNINLSDTGFFMIIIIALAVVNMLRPGNIQLLGALMFFVIIILLLTKVIFPSRNTYILLGISIALMAAGSLIEDEVKEAVE